MWADKAWRSALNSGVKSSGPTLLRSCAHTSTRCSTTANTDPHARKHRHQPAGAAARWKAGTESCSRCSGRWTPVRTCPSHSTQWSLCAASGASGAATPSESRHPRCWRRSPRRPTSAHQTNVSSGNRTSTPIQAHLPTRPHAPVAAWGTTSARGGPPFRRHLRWQSSTETAALAGTTIPSSQSWPGQCCARCCTAGATRTGQRLRRSSRRSLQPVIRQS